MTRKEAIKTLQELWRETNDSWYEETYNMAIEALEQEETLQNLTKPNKSDVISRQAAIDVVRQYCIDNQIENGDYHANGVEHELNELPSAQPFTTEQIQTMQELESAQIEKAYELGKADRPTGFWHIDAGVGCFCSKCGFDIGNDFDFMEYVRFCPNCGSYNGGDTDGSD